MSVTVRLVREIGLTFPYSDVTFQDDTGRKYKWRGNAPGRTLEVRTRLH